MILFEHLGILPLFNPDLDDMHIAEVKLLRDAVQQADGLMIASPEYAHGISGVMKNALDWLVSDENFPGKPVLLLNTSPRASHAQKYSIFQSINESESMYPIFYTVSYLGLGQKYHRKVCT